MYAVNRAAAALLLAVVASAQCTNQTYNPNANPNLEQNLPVLNTFNATPGSLYYNRTSAIIQAANISDDIKPALQVASSFERTGWAGRSVHDDPFYRVTRNVTGLQAGIPLKVENNTNTTLYSLPPEVALSRFQFTSKNLNGDVIPASAYVLWPYEPRSFPNVSGIPMVSFGHGDSGTSGECAPSHIRYLWYEFAAPFPLALDGYAVVAADYAGLGVDRDAAGNLVPYEIGAAPAAANDLVYAAKAAQKAFPELSKQFVVMGHSTGGGAAWGAAQLMANASSSLKSGYLGAISGSPPTTTVELLKESRATVSRIISLFAYGAMQFVPGFKLSDWLSPEGEQRLLTTLALNGSQSTTSVLFEDPDTIAPNWNVSTGGDMLRRFSAITSAGGKPIAGPMLVLQGTSDDTVPYYTTSATVNNTCAVFANKHERIDYSLYADVGHVPVLFASRRYWLDWIAARFRGDSPGLAGCYQRNVSSLREANAYQTTTGYVLEYSTNQTYLGEVG